MTTVAMVTATVIVQKDSKSINYNHCDNDSNYATVAMVTATVIVQKDSKSINYNHCDNDSNYDNGSNGDSDSNSTKGQ